MKTSELLAHLKGLGVRLWTEGGELRLSAPKGVLTSELKAELSARKPELLEALDAAAQSVDPGWTAQGAQAASAIPRAARGTNGQALAELPLSFTQQRLWFLQQLDPQLSAYNIPMSWILRGVLDAPALERALREITRRHEGLRTVFPPERGRPTQDLLPVDELVLERIENRDGLPADDWRTKVRQLLEARAHEPFDLARGPLLRPTLAQLAPDEHVLFVLVHHIVFDGSSIQLFLEELRALYAAYSQGLESTLSEPSLQYADFASWQNERMRGPELERMLAYWRNALAGNLPVLELPLDHPRPAVQTYHGSKVHVPLERADVERLERLAKQEGATLFMGLLAAYAALLSRYSGQDDVVVASPIAGRGFEGLERLIGFFANTLVLRTSLAGAPGFRELLRRVRDTCLGAFEHQEMPFERLVDELAPERTLSYTPLFQTLFLIEEAYGRDGRPAAAADPSEKLSFEPYELSTRVARTDLMVYAYRADDTWSLWAEYNTDLFEAATAERLLKHFVRLLRASLEDPDRALTGLELLNPAERNQLLVDWNRQGEPFPEEAIHARFEAQVEATPDAVALLFPDLGDGRGDVRLSYRELDAAANRLARRLVELRVEPGSLVGMCLERSPAMLIAMLAIQKAGAAYVPLDPSYPAERLVYMAEDSHLAFVVTHGELDRLFASIEGLCIVHLEREAQAIDAQDAGSLGLAVDARERMYVIYTSGSTGRPKGVQLEHRSVSNFLSSMAAEPGLTAGELLLALTTPSFDISVLELFLPLVSGATVAIAPREATADGSVLKALIERLEPDVMQATPASWRMLLVAGWQGASELRAFCGGEALARELADELLERSKELWNLYGPTEATIWSSVERVGSEGPITIGKPIQNTRIYVLDKHRNPVPVGVTGELWIAGDGLARGYLERPELDRERFVPDPFYAGPGAGHERMYVTGDLARWRADGRIECLGRVDHQVKLRGFRIELGEIESVLAEVPGVHECVAIVREDTPGDQRLAAYYTLEAGQAAAGPAPTIDHERLRQAGRERLPAYMVPSLFQALDALPLTPNGKVDRNALHALDAQGALPEVEYVAPQNATEERIAAIWGEVLGLERVTVHTNFFDLGGHSLLLAQVHARLQEHHPALSIIELFQHPTVSSLAEHVLTEPAQARESSRSRRLSAGRQALMQRRRIKR